MRAMFTGLLIEKQTSKTDRFQIQMKSQMQDLSTMLEFLVKSAQAQKRPQRMNLRGYDSGTEVIREDTSEDSSIEPGKSLRSMPVQIIIDRDNDTSSEVGTKKSKTLISSTKNNSSNVTEFQAKKRSMNVSDY